MEAAEEACTGLDRLYSHGLTGCNDPDFLELMDGLLDPATSMLPEDIAHRFVQRHLSGQRMGALAEQLTLAFLGSSLVATLTLAALR